MEHYVTLFDSTFLPQGLALHRSMERWCGDFTLWVVCMDEATEEILNELGLPSVKTIPVRTVETDELLAVKSGRTIAEYCWTITSFVPQAVFALEPSATRVTYLDADLWFRASPSKIFAEFESSGAAVLITEHGFSPENDQSASAGIFCVQFMTFANCASSGILQRWQVQCTEWCFNRHEDGKFGDQKYLDTWPADYGNAVHVLTHTEWAQAPWNATRFPYSSGVFFHFHGLRLLSPNSVSPGIYVLPQPLIDNVYGPYLEDLGKAVNRLASDTDGIPPRWNQQASESRLRTRIRYWRRRYRLIRTPSHMRIRGDDTGGSVRSPRL